WCRWNSEQQRRSHNPDFLGFSFRVLRDPAIHAKVSRGPWPRSFERPQGGLKQAREVKCEPACDTRATEWRDFHAISTKDGKHKRRLRDGIAYRATGFWVLRFDRSQRKRSGGHYSRSAESRRETPP
uniref:Uncharacterized protein n=1 Tax=Anopheles albimanus TaxID=7167 RepID=A0A182FXG4_ANOAL